MFTQSFAAVLGGREDAEPFAQFLQLAGDAFNVLRRNADLLMVLFVLMLSSGIPELQTAGAA